MFQQFKIITLCGSTKFKEDFMKANAELTLQGNIVISVGVFGHSDCNYMERITDDIKIILDNIHKRKIDMSDEIFVINTNGYIGNSTKSEIEYALKHNKIVKYMYEI